MANQPPCTLGLMAAALTPRRGWSSHAVGCDIPGLGRRSDDVTGHPRRIGRRPNRSLSSRTLGWTKTAWTRIGVAGWSPTENGSIAGCVPRRGVAVGVVRTSAGVQGSVRDPGTRVRPGTWSGSGQGGGPGPGSGLGPGFGPGHDPGPGSGPGVVRDPVRDPGVVRALQGHQGSGQGVC